MIMNEKSFLLKPMLIAFGASLLISTATARTWTSEDGSKTFEGDFVSFEGGKVTVDREGGKEMSFKLEMLSEADQKWVEEEVARKAELAALASAAVPVALEGNLLKLSGKRLRKFEPEAPSKYYLLYFSASW